VAGEQCLLSPTSYSYLLPPASYSYSYSYHLLPTAYFLLVLGEFSALTNVPHHVIPLRPPFPPTNSLIHTSFLQFTSRSVVHPGPPCTLGGTHRPQTQLDSHTIP